MKVAVVPFYKSQLGGAFFDTKSRSNRDNALDPFVSIKRIFQLQNIEVDTIDNVNMDEADGVIFFSLNISILIKAFIKGKLNRSIYVSFEPPVVRPIHSPWALKIVSKAFRKVLTWQDDLVGTNNFEKFFFPVPDLRHKVEIKNFKDRKFLTSIVGYKKYRAKNELYSQRITAIRYFEKKYPKSFEFYGVGWSREKFPSYRGPVDSKLEVLKSYKFSICYENEKEINGLISEKIFDCFFAGVVPIYWGAKNIERYIPKECYIDKRDFSDYTSLGKYIDQISSSQYYEYLSNIERFLESGCFEKHLSHCFARKLMEAVVNEGEHKIKSFDVYVVLATLLINKVWVYLRNKTSRIYK
ncbi:glycosyltransferase family 10 domain-containing protein [Hahella ganghwensis]|uniref:glycosyltransferase family 10 domain-containing protein n=1 Tax=Hahella ganghwensis TaxID=286420 RepID=UPI0003699A39|nr:glycosyltransferase family 10 [Hahella ganghwensis]